MIRSVVPILGYAGYPLAIAGGLLIFGTCSLLTLDMVSANIAKTTAPIAASADFNVPPVQQIGSLDREAAAAAKTEPAPRPQPESSIVAVAPPTERVAVALTPAEPGAAPVETSFASIDPPGLGSGSIGGQAVNVRAAPSRTGARIGVLNAGSPVRIGENIDGWIHVYYAGGDGWVYQSYLAGG